MQEYATKKQNPQKMRMIIAQVGKEVLRQEARVQQTEEATYGLL